MAKLIGLVYALSGLVVMWAFWVSFVIFLCEPRRLLGSWPSQPLITGDGCKSRRPRSCSIYVLSPYSRCNTLGWPAPGSRTTVTRMPGPFAHCTYVHMANTALFLVIIFWQPIPVDVWATHEAVA